MGNSESAIPEEMIDDYLQWTYLNRLEIESLFKKFASFAVSQNILDERIHVMHVLEMIPQIKYNLFCDRILKVFSSKSDGCFSFEDLLDFFSVMSAKCPTHVKARWAYRLFDFNDDSEITKEDLVKLFDRLTKIGGDSSIEEQYKHKIIDVIMTVMDIEKNGAVGPSEFEHAVSNVSDFRSAFTFSVQ